MALGGSAPRRYAEALFEVATGENAVAAYRASLERLAGALGGDVVRWLRDRRVPLQRRRDALEKTSAGEPAAIRAVLVLLLERDRVGILPDISRAFGDLVDRSEGIVKAKVTTPIELARSDRDRMVEQLQQATGKRIRARFAVDPALVGGATIQLGDHLIDASVRARLDALRIQLAS